MACSRNCRQHNIWVTLAKNHAALDGADRIAIPMNNSNSLTLRLKDCHENFNGIGTGAKSVMEDMPGRVVCMLHEIVKNWAGYPAATTRHKNPNTSNTHVLQGQCLVVQHLQERKRTMSRQYSPCVYVQSGGAREDPESEEEEWNLGPNPVSRPN